jgi:hypothetical protein
VTNSRLLSVLALLPPLGLTGCTRADVQSQPLDRAAEGPRIIEQVLRYEIHQFSSKAGPDGGPACVAVREGGRLVDPSPTTMLRLGAKARPQSECNEAAVLIAGPVEWQRDDEVRVRGGQKQWANETSLAYRVVREDGNWRCVGPIIPWDPL